MPRRLLLLGISAVGVVVAGSAASSSSLAPPRLKGPPQVLAQLGYVRSLKPQGNAFELRFDTAQWLGAATARREAVDTVRSIDQQYQP